MASLKFSVHLKISALSLIGTTIVLIATSQYGAGISADSATYISVGRNLLKGLGFSTLSGSNQPIPMTHFPPLYPILLTIFGSFGLDPANGARWLNAFLFGTNILLTGLLIHKHTRSVSVSVLGSLFVLTSGDMLRIHSMAWTEPLFILFSLSGLFLLAAYIEHRKLFLLIASAIVISFAFLTKYSGITLIATVIIGIALFTKETHSRKMIDAIVFFLISSLTMALWLLRNLIITGSFTDRKIVFHLITLRDCKSAWHTLASWFLLSGRTFLFVAAIVMFFILIVLLLKRQCFRIDFGIRHFGKLPSLLAVFVISYGLFLIIAVSFFDAAIPFNYRILSPVYISGLIILLCVAHTYSHFINRKNSILKVIVSGLCIIFAGVCLMRALALFEYIYNNGQGFASKSWRQSEVLQKVKSLPHKIPIYSNGPDALYIISGRSAFMIPCKFDSGTQKINARYPAETAEMAEQLTNQNGVLVFFDKMAGRWYLPSESELRNQLPLRLLSRTSDGKIYKIE